MPKLLLGFLIVAAAILYILFFSPLTKIKSADVSGADGCLPKQLSLEEFKLENMHLLTFTKSDLEQKVLSRYGCVKRVSIKRVFPSSLKLEAQLQLPILKVADTNFFLTEDGLVSTRADISKVPIFYPDRNLNLKLGERLQDEDVGYILKLVSELAKSDFTAASIRILDQDSIAVYNVADLVVIFSTKKPTKEQVDTLQLVLSKTKIDAAKIAKIDLRFDKPVASYR